MLRNQTHCLQHLSRHRTTDTCIFAVTLQWPSENAIPTISWEMGELHVDKLTRFPSGLTQWPPLQNKAF